jgi:hypothetical protein
LGQRVIEHGRMNFLSEACHLPGRCPSLRGRLGLRPACCLACAPVCFRPACCRALDVDLVCLASLLCSEGRTAPRCGRSPDRATSGACATAGLPEVPSRPSHQAAFGFRHATVPREPQISRVVAGLPTVPPPAPPGQFAAACDLQKVPPGRRDLPAAPSRPAIRRAVETAAVETGTQLVLGNWGAF